MSIIDTLIYDRTQADVTRWQRLQGNEFRNLTPSEQAEWMGGMKGSYNPVNDMNRVGLAVAYIAGLLAEYGYIVDVSPKTDWGIGDEPILAQLERYQADVATIRGVVGAFATTPEAPPDVYGLTWQEANDIEKILLDVDRVLAIIASTFVACGEATSGGDYL